MQTASGGSSPCERLEQYRIPADHLPGRLRQHFVVARRLVRRFRARQFHSQPRRAMLVQRLHMLPAFCRPFVLPILKEMPATCFWHSSIPKNETSIETISSSLSQKTLQSQCSRWCEYVWIGFEIKIYGKAKYKKQWRMEDFGSRRGDTWPPKGYQVPPAGGQRAKAPWMVAKFKIL